MATVNFSVPEDIKADFNETFARENKSAIISRLMRSAIDERRRQQRRAAAIDELVRLRNNQRPVDSEEVPRARKADRP